MGVLLKICCIFSEHLFLWLLLSSKKTRQQTCSNSLKKSLMEEIFNSVSALYGKLAINSQYFKNPIQGVIKDKGVVAKNFEIFTGKKLDPFTVKVTGLDVKNYSRRVP